MKNLEALLIEYGESHQNKTNLKLHMVCVPLIEWSLLGLFSLIPHPWHGSVNFAELFALAALLYYVQFKNWKVLLGTILMLAFYLEVIAFLSSHSVMHRLIFYFTVFAVAWVGQFVGHHIEGKKPSFFKDLFFLLIGPLWVLEEYLQILHCSIRKN